MWTLSFRVLVKHCPPHLFLARKRHARTCVHMRARVHAHTHTCKHAYTVKGNIVFSGRRSLVLRVHTHRYMASLSLQWGTSRPTKMEWVPQGSGTSLLSTYRMSLLSGPAGQWIKPLCSYTWHLPHSFAVTPPHTHTHTGSRDNNLGPCSHFLSPAGSKEQHPCLQNNCFLPLNLLT